MQTTDYTITKAGRRWAVIEIATDEAQVYLDTKRDAQRWIERWVANSNEWAAFEAERRAARLARIEAYLAERAERRDNQLTMEF